MSKSPRNPYQKKRASDKEKHEKVEKFRLEEKIFEGKMVEFLEKVEMEMETENKLENEMIVLLEKVEREKKALSRKRPVHLLYPLLDPRCRDHTEKKRKLNPVENYRIQKNDSSVSENSSKDQFSSDAQTSEKEEDEKSKSSCEVIFEETM